MVALGGVKTFNFKCSTVGFLVDLWPHIQNALHHGSPLQKRGHFHQWCMPKRQEEPLSTFLQLLVYLAENLTVFGCFGAHVYAPLFFIWTKTDQHNVLVTHYGIRRLQSNTLWAGFPSRDILLGGGGCWGPACQSRQSKLPSDRSDRAVRRGGRKRGGKRCSAAILTRRVWLSLSIMAVFVSFHHSH